MSLSAEEMDGMSDEDWDEYGDEKLHDGEGDWPDGEGADIDFAEPGGESSLRAATDSDPRDQPCPDCDKPNRLTSQDVALGYCCNSCAKINEGWGY